MIDSSFIKEKYQKHTHGFYAAFLFYTTVNITIWKL